MRKCHIFNFCIYLKEFSNYDEKFHFQACNDVGGYMGFTAQFDPRQYDLRAVLLDDGGYMGFTAQFDPRQHNHRAVLLINLQIL